MHSSELASFDAALKAAGERLATARAAEVAAVDRQKAEEMRNIVGEIAQVPAFVDKHLAAAADGLLAIEAGFNQLRELGIKHPNDAQVRLAIVACINTWAMRLPRSWHSELRDGLRFLGPLDRKTCTAWWRALEPSLQNAIGQHLGEAARDKEVA